MNDVQILELWGPTRNYFIESHQFYVNQARKRLLMQFENMEDEAEQYANDWLEKNEHRYDPEQVDLYEIGEYAYDASLDFYINLSNLKDETRFSILAGVYHKWDKQLRDWLVNEIRHWEHRDIIKQQLWKKNIGEIFDFLESLGWDVKNQVFYKRLDACRLIVNVYKHGNGNSLEDLKIAYPDFIENPLVGLDKESYMQYVDYTNLKISDKDLYDFADAITDFWKSVPERFFKSQIKKFPVWLEKAIEKS